MPFPVTEDLQAKVPYPRMYSNKDFTGGQSTFEIQKDMNEKQILDWELAFVRKHMPKTQADLNNYYISTCCPGYWGGELRTGTAMEWGWQYEHRRAPWYSQGYLKSPSGDGDSGRNPGGGMLWGVVEWGKILMYEGWRLRRNTWKFLVAFMVTMWPVKFRDYIYDPTKEMGIEGYAERRRKGAFHNYYGGLGSPLMTAYTYWTPLGAWMEKRV